MAIINVSNSTSIDNEQSVSVVSKLSDLGNKYAYSVGFTSSSSKKVSYFSSNNVIDFSLSGTSLNYTIYDSTDYITSDGTLKNVTGNGNRVYTQIDSGTDVYIRKSLFVAPNISIKSHDIGNIVDFSPIQYNVITGNGDSFNLTEELDGNILRSLSDQSSGSSFTIDLSNIWSSLSYGKHYINIKAIDLLGIESEPTTITFNKIKAPITSIPTNSTLTQAVNHMVELNKEIDYQELKLSNNLVAKGVEVLPTDKMSNLIDKVGTIATGKKWASGICNDINISKTTTWTAHKTNFNLDFTPQKVILNISKMSVSNVGTIERISIDSSMAISSSQYLNINANSIRYWFYIILNNDGFTLNVYYSQGSTYSAQLTGLTWEAYE